MSFGSAVIDVDERRDVPAPHRFVHGGFEGSDTRFAIYLPEHYGGRMVQYLMGGLGGDEFGGFNLGALDVAFANGAFLVESNQGHVVRNGGPRASLHLPEDLDVLAWRASVETARFAKALAREHYGAEPHHAYVFGGSGGGARTINCVDHAPDMYDGAVPYVLADEDLLWHSWSASGYAARVLRDRIGEIDSAVLSGTNPFDVLHSSEERHALEVAYRAGYPHGAEFLLANPSLAAYLGLGYLARSDPEFVRDFWEIPGHAGYDGSSIIPRIRASVRVKQVVTVAELLAHPEQLDLWTRLQLSIAPPPPGTPMGIRVDRPIDALGAILRAGNRELFCSSATGDLLLAGMEPKGFSRIDQGDQIHVDNAEYVAWIHYHRHHADPYEPTMRQMFVDGVPVHPQRPHRPGERRFASVPFSYKFKGKIIAVHNTYDESALPRYGVKLAQGVGDADDRFRLWWTEKAAHTTPTGPVANRLVDSWPSIAQAVADLITWVEEDVKPPPSTSYSVSPDGAIELAPTAEARRGIQPVVRISVPAEARAGESVRLEGHVDAPPDAGQVCEAAWDPSGAGTFDLMSTTADHVYDRPGVYLATFRGSLQRHDRAPRIDNIAHARIIVR